MFWAVTQGKPHRKSLNTEIPTLKIQRFNERSKLRSFIDTTPGWHAVNQDLPEVKRLLNEFEEKPSLATLSWPIEVLMTHHHKKYITLDMYAAQYPDSKSAWSPA